MSTPHQRPSVALILAACVTLAACASDGDTANSDSVLSDSVMRLLETVPPEARVPMGAGETRSSRDWIEWSTCGDGSRAETAAANGGPAAGWFLVDDLLADPGIALGGWRVMTCRDAVQILHGGTGNPLAALAQQLFTAKLNFEGGSGRCEAATDLVVAGDGLLTHIAYGGPATAADTLEDETVTSLANVAGLLSTYNAGVLCQ